MSVTSSKLATIASDLTALGKALGERVTDFSDVIESTRTAIELIDRSWNGPLPDEMEGQVTTYVDSVASVIGATESAQTTVDAWATAATDASERLAALESDLADTNLAISAVADPDAASTLEDSRQRISSDIDDEVAAWATTCSTKGGQLASAISTMQRCSLVEMGTADQRSALLGDSYSFGLAAWAVRSGMDLATLDPTGTLGRVAQDRLAEFAGGAYAGLLYAVIETMNQADISEMDGKSSKDDWVLSGDPEVVRFRLEMAARLAGIELSEDQLDALTSQIITIAVFGAATDDDGRGAVDDRFDENADIESALDAGGQTEHDFEFPDNPSDADEYVQTWLEAQWESNPGVLDYAKMILVPDFNVMNPWSDEFHPGWALVEVAGIIPWTKAGKLLTLAKLGRHGDEVAEAMTLFDEGADILSGSGRVADDVAGVGDDVLSAGDDIAQSGDDVAGAVDDVPTSRLPSTDPQVIAEIDEVRAPVLDELQAQVDRIWAETDDALPNGSPQQRGTYAHTQLEHWITDHADEVVDPSTGYRIRAEVSFGDVNGTGTEVVRGTSGSIRPDVIMERRVVAADGATSWEVVEVADLKTGRAGIKPSWQESVDNWIQPQHTTEIRPGSPTPIPE